MWLHHYYGASIHVDAVPAGGVARFANSFLGGRQLGLEEKFTAPALHAWGFSHLPNGRQKVLPAERAS
jgi:hypothetical protein